jgi:deoxyribonuclease-4
MTKYIGAHLSKQGGSIIKTIDVVKNAGGNALQIFASNPRSTHIPNMTSYENVASDVNKYCKQNDFKLVIHAPYTINLAKEPKIGKRIVELKDCYWIDSLLHELIVSDMIGATGVVVHVGKHTTNTKEDGLKYMFESIQYLIREMKSREIKSKLIIETPAGVGTELLTTIEEFISFFNQFSREEKKYIGMCLDTAHIWSSGYDINEYFERITRTNAKDIIVIHFNNSKKNQGSNVDVHDNIFDGKIQLSDMNKFITDMVKQKLSKPIIILEKPSNDLCKDIEWISNI